MIAALYVQADGCYANLPGVDPWPVTRDARLYAGPWPVVAHPPCERWGRYWGGSPTTWPRKVRGNDGGCFAAALAAVRRWGGVIEHPQDSHAWTAFGLVRPPRLGGWVRADWAHGFDGWTCRVEQGAYGHRARKGTWLYVSGVELPALAWGRAAGDFLRLEDGFHSADERRRAIRSGIAERLSHRQRAATPLPFRDLLLSIARSHATCTPSEAGGSCMASSAVCARAVLLADRAKLDGGVLTRPAVSFPSTTAPDCHSTRQTMERIGCCVNEMEYGPCP